MPFFCPRFWKIDLIPNKSSYLVISLRHFEAIVPLSSGFPVILGDAVSVEVCLLSLVALGSSL